MTVPRPVTSQRSPWESLCLLSLPSSLAVVLCLGGPQEIFPSMFAFLLLLPLFRSCLGTGRLKLHECSFLISFGATGS